MFLCAYSLANAALLWASGSIYPLTGKTDDRKSPIIPERSCTFTLVFAA